MNGQYENLLIRIWESSPVMFILFIVIAGIFITAVLLLLAVIKKKDKISITIGRKKSIETVNHAVSHALGKESVELENKRLKLQMIEARQMAGSIKRLMFGCILALVKQKRGGEREDLMEYREVIHYRSIIESGLFKCLQAIEDMFMANHFADMSDEQFDIASDEWVKELGDMMTQHLDDEWRGKDIVEAEVEAYEEKISNELERDSELTGVDLKTKVYTYVREFRKEHMKKAVTRIDIFKYQKETVLTEVLQILKKTFMKARVIAIEIREEINRVDYAMEELNCKEAS